MIKNQPFLNAGIIQGFLGNVVHRTEAVKRFRGASVIHIEFKRFISIDAKLLSEKNLQKQIINPLVN